MFPMPPREPTVAPVAVAAKPKKRCLPPALLQGKACRLMRPQAPALPEPGHVQSKLNLHIQTVVVTTGSASTRFTPSELSTRAEVMPLFQRLLDKASDARLASLIGTLKRWIRYAECHVASDRTALALAAFLHELSKGGRGVRRQNCLS